ncbi:tetratricopeptide repeat protein [Shewanella gelidii]|uniref:DUF4145 domain-containing protein n=1 Tax=Shewanella gelidii TaxID=1642821 RepID=A0A917JUK0_9GAMM|nr:tetratricopeptide repeat protein [Shewanella gelidii]MCL1098516.1 DUF4145 domain-containing protein [Shewanella gelidii]GGI82151.1 hypothetical protein GCM10009332_19220 [Shewanella gelidii]
MLNDTEFASLFSASIGEDYRLAKSYVHDVPTQTLLRVRSICHRLTQLIAEQQRLELDSPNLFDRIERLNQQRVIDARIARKLHKLRAGGNRGAHPEKFHLTLTQLIELAQKSIADLLLVLEQVSTLCIAKSSPDYLFVPFDVIAGRDLCYRAVMEADVEAQYLVGMSLKSKALLLKEQAQIIEQQQSLDGDTHTQASENSLNAQVEASFEQAAYWFSTASHRHPRAQFEYGVCLLHGYGVKQDVITGEHLIASAAAQRVDQAMALLGYFYLVGSETLAQDLGQAKVFLLQAAELDVAEAMANLGVYYYQRQALSESFLWIQKAAQAGYPHSQFHLALMLASGEGCDVDLQASQVWMQEAAVQGQVDAMLHVATQILDGAANESEEPKHLSKQLSVKDAERYLQQAIQYEYNVPAMIELSIALADGVLGRIDVVGSAALLVLAKNHATAEELEVIRPLWDSLSLQVEQVQQITLDPEQLKSLTRAQELLKA